MAKETEAAERARLQAAIARITNRVCVSNDLGYLRRRLVDLEARKRAGETVKHGASSQDDDSTILSVSMPAAARAAAVEIGNRLKIGTSAAVRLALRDFASEKCWLDLALKFED